jgi:UDP-N-acetyl-D-glucosamine dehydrogenase
VHIVGVAYKRNIDDVRESPALDLIHLLEKRGATVTYSDPYVPSIRLENRSAKAEDLMSNAAKADCCVIVTDHSDFDYDGLVATASLIVDTRNALKGRKSSKIVRL